MCLLINPKVKYEVRTREKDKYAHREKTEECNLLTAFNCYNHANSYMARKT
jgi:hypothetical protein